MGLGSKWWIGIDFGCAYRPFTLRPSMNATIELICNITILGQTFRIRDCAELTTEETKKLENMKVSEAIQLVKDTNTQLIKSKGEILGKIAQLENADGELTEEQSAIVADLRTLVQAQDDIIPDVPVVTPDDPKSDGGDTAE